MAIEHIALYVNNLDAARYFFTTYLGGKSNDGYHNPRTDFRSYFISFDDGARLDLMTKPGMVDQEKPLNRTGYAHIAFSVGSKDRKLLTIFYSLIYISCVIAKSSLGLHKYNRVIIVLLRMS